MHFTILRYEEISSTNDEAMRQAKLGADEGLCVVSRGQTAGRGRLGRTWISKKDAGLFFSVVLRPKIETRFLPLITLAASIAVHDALEELYDFECDIKWANDIMVGEKKICGILAESCDTGFGLAVILGIGINLTSGNFPPEISETATSIEQESHKFPDIEILLQKLTPNLEEVLEKLYSPSGNISILDGWKARSSYAFGKSVSVSLSSENFPGTTRGIEDDGALRVETLSGEIRTVRAGDITKLRAS